MKKIVLVLVAVALNLSAVAAMPGEDAELQLLAQVMEKIGRPDLRDRLAAALKLPSGSKDFSERIAADDAAIDALLKAGWNWDKIIELLSPTDPQYYADLSERIGPALHAKG